MNRFKFLHFFTLFFFILNTNLQALEIKNFAIINNKSITNYDLFNEIKLLEFLENRKIQKSEHVIILKKMINEKIKKIESEESSVIVSKISVEKQYNNFIKANLRGKEISIETKKKLMMKIENSIRWNKLINIRYRDKLSVNMNEINEILKKNKISFEKKNDMIDLEKNKRLQTFSNTHFNKIKKKYLVKTYL